MGRLFYLEGIELTETVGEQTAGRAKENNTESSINKNTKATRREMGDLCFILKVSSCTRLGEWTVGKGMRAAPKAVQIRLLKCGLTFH